ncbi:hypothetical protein [Nocardioides panacisoli]|uniref:Uncharacterized protein n=1 Tax=Nocardioides panacisoli TaxID=627624 RepID=A0ABP7IGI1_9ACTN
MTTAHGSPLGDGQEEPVDSYDAMCRLEYLRTFEDSEPDMECFPAYNLSVAEHDELAAAYDRIKQANHPPMIEILGDLRFTLHDTVRRYLQALESGARVSPAEVTRVARVTAFAAVNAVYSFGEYVEAELRHRGGKELWEPASAVFTAVYDENPHFLLADKLRQVFSHRTMEALKVHGGSKITALGQDPTFTVACVLDRTKLLERLENKTRRWLLTLDEDVALDDVLAASIHGMARVYRAVRPMLFPDEARDLTALSRYRTEFLNLNYPLTLSRYTIATDGTLGPWSHTSIDAAELTAAGLKPLSREEWEASSTQASARIDSHRSAITHPPHSPAFKDNPNADGLPPADGQSENNRQDDVS